MPYDIAGARGINDPELYVGKFIGKITDPVTVDWLGSRLLVKALEPACNDRAVFAVIASRTCESIRLGSSLCPIPRCWPSCAFS